MEYSFKIISAEVKGEEVAVKAIFYKGDEEVKEINHAFSRSMNADEIRGEVGKALDLYVVELEQKKEQIKIDKAIEKDKELINNLIDN